MIEEVMPRNILLLIMFAIILSMIGCESKSNIGSPREFFEKNKIGTSADYGIIKWGDSNDHVVTVHGFMDDLKSCALIADALNKDACSETDGSNCHNPFSCQALNH